MAAAPTPPAPDDDGWTAGQQVAALPEMWALFAEHGGDLVEAWRLTHVCKAARVGVKGWLGTLPGLVVCGGITGGGGEVTEVSWRLDLATMRWAPMPALVSANVGHSSCVVTGALVVLGGATPGGGGVLNSNSRVQILSEGAAAFVNLPPLSCGKIWEAAAIGVEESESAAGQMLLLGGLASPGGASSSVHLLDLATGMCTPQPGMLHARRESAAAKMVDGRVVCAGGGGPGYSSAEVFGPPLQGGLDAAWGWRPLPDMSVGRLSCCGCVMSDGRFAVFGGGSVVAEQTCESLVIDNNNAAHWEPLPLMHTTRRMSACAAVAGCVIVVGGFGLKSCEVYHEARGRWLRLPCDIPCERQLYGMGSAMHGWDVLVCLHHAAWVRARVFQLRHVAVKR
jgi:hypothetical protein